MSTTERFTLFSQLPTEIRLEIFYLTRFHQPPRIIEASHLPCSWNSTTQTNNGPSGYPVIMTEWCTVTPSARRFPVCFHVSREAREASKKHFSWLSMGTWFDYERDYLYFGEEVTIDDTFNLLTLGLRVGGDIMTKRLRYLAILSGEFDGHEVFEKMSDPDFAELVHALKEYVCVFGNDEDALMPGSVRKGHDCHFVACEWGHITTDSLENMANSEFDIVLAMFKECYRGELSRFSARGEDPKADLTLPEVELRDLFRLKDD